MNSSFFRILLIATCIFTLVAESKAGKKRLTREEINAFYTRFYNNIPKMKSYDNLKVNITELNKKFVQLRDNADVEESLTTEINDTLVEFEKKTKKSLQIFTTEEFDVWKTVIEKINLPLSTENISFGLNYISHQYATVLNKENILKITECSKDNEVTVKNCIAILTRIKKNINTTAELTKTNLDAANEDLKKLLTFKNDAAIISCKTNNSLTDDGKKLLELAQPLAKEATVISPWKNIITIGVAVVGTISTLTLLGARFLIGSSS